MKLKRISAILFCVVFVSCLPFAFSACWRNTDIPALSINYDYVCYRRAGYNEENPKNIYYPEEVKAWGDFYYKAGHIFEYGSGKPITVKHIAAEINGVPVLELGFEVFMNTAHLSHGSSTLEKLYIPGTVIDLGVYLRNSKDSLECFYCGKPINLVRSFNSYLNIYVPVGHAESFYVPNQMYDEYVELMPEDWDSDIPFYRANISYRLNAPELPRYYQTEYYYVDYVKYGETIENVPPKPTLQGYKFGGWYTEAACINQWNFANAVPQPAQGEDFNELCLYAKWTKK